jgi:outer membrane protein assembly factor BamB
VQTSRGAVALLDGETGRTLWATQVGPPDRVSTEPDANEEFVAVVNGSSLYVLDRLTGHVLWQRTMGGVPGAGPAVTTTHAFVAMLNGRIEGYDLKLGAKQKPWNYKSAGRISVPPVASAQSVCWTTRQGYFYVADPNADGVRYRLETRAAIESRPACWSPHVFAGSTDGFLYSLNELSGKLDWKFPVGDAIYSSPVAIEDKVFVVSEFAGLYCLDSKLGEPLWLAPGITQFVSMSPSRVYAIDRRGGLVALDAKSGTPLGSMPLAGTVIKLPNGQSDRLYLASNSSVVQCLREIALKSPVMHIPPAAVDDKAQRVKDKKSPGESPSESTLDEPAAADADDSSEPAMSDDAPAEDLPAENPTDDDADNPFK